MLFANRAAIYVRHSSEEPATSQVERLDAYARGQGYQIADQHYYGDSRAEGTPAHASDTFYAMMRAAARGEFAALFITTAARITSDPTEWETVKGALERAKVALIALDDRKPVRTVLARAIQKLLFREIDFNTCTTSGPRPARNYRWYTTLYMAPQSPRSDAR